MSIITVSRGSMSGGESLAECLASTLGYPCVGRNILVEAAASVGVSEETLISKFERSPSLWGRLTSDRRFYVIAVQSALLEQASSGDLVYHGHAGHLLLKDIPNVLRVRLIAPLEMRAQSVMEQQHLTRDAAVEYIRNIDEDRVRWTKFIFGVDWRDPNLYDMVLSLENMSIKAACSIVSQAANQPEFVTSESERKILKDQLLASRVQVALIKSPRTRSIEFEVTSNDGMVEIFGEMPSASLMPHGDHRGDQEILRTVEKVSGVRSVRLHIEQFDPYR